MPSPTLPALLTHDALLQPPAGFTTLSSASAVQVDGVPAWHLRYHRDDGANRQLGGEHYSMVLSLTGKLIGKSWFNLDLCKGELPGAGQAQRIAFAYLEQHAPDLLPELALQWVQPHDETLSAQQDDGSHRPHTLTGMKVKCRNEADGRYFWVIVGAGGVVITFERNVVWDFAHGQRQTEKWLHDSWLSEQVAALA